MRVIHYSRRFERLSWTEAETGQRGWTLVTKWREFYVTPIVRF